MSRQSAPRSLSRRESEILDIIHELGSASAADIHERLPDAPGYSSVRKLLEILEDKKVVKHVIDGRRFIYSPVTPRSVASKSALRHILNTFFGGSIEEAAVALFSIDGKSVDNEMLKRIARESRKASRDGR
jgi:predicted transcriptional regulator